MNRNYIIDFNDAENAAITIIQMHKETLISLREKTAHRDELEWEIRLYDFMLEDPVARLSAYQEARWPDSGSVYKEKRQVVQELSWNVL